MSSLRLGVDYGTSHCAAVLRWPDGRVRPLLFDGSPLLDSAVAIDADGQLIVGRGAVRSVRYAPQRFEPHPKRRIDDGHLWLGGTAVPVVTAVAATLREIWREATRVAGGGPVEVRLTCPATWAAVRRGLLVEAAAKAGMPATVLVSEPVAAATHFLRHVDGARGLAGDVVVFDLGAGTFDVTLVSIDGGALSVRASGGLDDVGGVDMDAAVVAVLLAGLRPGEAEPDPVGVNEVSARIELWQVAREAKEALSRRSSTQVAIPGVRRPRYLTRDELERVAAPLLERTIATTATVLQRGGVGRPDHILLVGGATRMPLVATMLHRSFGVAPTTLDHPELVVAEGSVEDIADTGSPASLPPPEPDPAADPTPSAVPDPDPTVPVGSPMPVGQPSAGRSARPARQSGRWWTHRRLGWSATGVVLLLALSSAAVILLRLDGTPTVTVDVRAEPVAYQSACPAPAGGVRFVGTIAVNRGPATVRYRWRRSMLAPTEPEQVRFAGSGAQQQVVTLNWSPGEGLDSWRSLEIVDGQGAAVATSQQVAFRVACSPGVEAGAPSGTGYACPIREWRYDGTRETDRVNAEIRVTDPPVTLRYRWSLTPRGRATTYTPEQTTTLPGAGPGKTLLSAPPQELNGKIDIRLEVLGPVAVISPALQMDC